MVQLGDTGVYVGRGEVWVCGWERGDTRVVMREISLGPRPKTNPSADRFQYRSDIRAG